MIEKEKSLEIISHIYVDNFIFDNSYLLLCIVFNGMNDDRTIFGLKN